MTSADWGILIPALAGCLAAAAAWLRAEVANRKVSAHITNQARHVQPGDKL